MTKNTSYHYSIIIPHKNTPRLLERCLCSIPTWDEIQIIIIDDNSNSESVDFSHFRETAEKIRKSCSLRREKEQDTHGT